MTRKFLYSKRKKSSGKKILHPKRRENQMKKICKKIEKKEEPDLPGRRTTAPAARSIPAISAPPRRATPLWAWSLPPHRSLRPQESDPEKEKRRREAKRHGRSSFPREIRFQSGAATFHRQGKLELCPPRCRACSSSGGSGLS